MLLIPAGRAFASLALVLGAAAVSAAADLPLPPGEPPVFLVILDLRNIEPGEITNTAEGGGPVSFPISAVDDEAIVCSAATEHVSVRQLKAYVECAIGHRLSGADFDDADSDPNNDVPTVAERRKAAAAIAASLVQLRKRSSTRAISDQGSSIVAVGLQTAEVRTIKQIAVAKCEDPVAEPERTTATTYQFVFGRKPQFTIAEVARKSQIATDFSNLLGLAAKFARAAAAPPPPAPDPCQRRATPTMTYESRSEPTEWSSGHAIHLALKRATVTVDGTLPGVAPQLLAATDLSTAKDVIKAADEFLRVDALRKQEAEDLVLLANCPAGDPGRLDSLEQVVCALDRGTSALAAVDALSKMTTPRRVTFLRWAVEHKSGEVRDKALVALAQIAGSAPTQSLPAGKEVKQTAKFLSGPLEHLSISADVFATRETPFKTDDSGALVIDGTPPVFYVSLNFLLGDLPSTERTLVQNIELKWMLQGSDSPFDSIGFGIGLRGSYAKRFGIDFDLLSPFVGWTWTVQEESSQPRVLQTRFGVGVNINKALDWVR